MADLRELLENAGRAIGINVNVIHGRGVLLDYVDDLNNGDALPVYWNPAEDSGQGAEMEAVLHMDLIWWDDRITVKPAGRSATEHFKDHPSPQAARRMASLRAASEIGRSMKHD